MSVPHKNQLLKIPPKLGAKDYLIGTLGTEIMPLSLNQPQIKELLNKLLQALVYYETRIQATRNTKRLGGIMDQIYPDQVLLLTVRKRHENP
jgi:hypothetical protein